MKYLVAFDTNIVPQNLAADWGVDKVLIFGNDLTERLLNLPEDRQPMSFFIPTVVDYSNSLSYSGVNLSLRILLKYISIGRTDIDIVLMGNESETNFLLHYDYPNILKIPGIHYIGFNKKIVASHVLPKREFLVASDYIPYLDNLGLKIPSSFKSTHSLTNEWCLFKWNSFMGFSENASSLEGHLYFDYLITLEKLSLIKSKKVSDHLKDRISDIPALRILIIDDKEGWHKFFKEMFSKTDGVVVHCMGENFNKLTFEDIVKRIIENVNDFNPHIIILDFRLMEDKDAECKDDMKQISGYRILTKVLKGDYKNPLGSFGRQVIIFTATSRIENILLLRNGNADGFILKEKPENYKGKENTKTVISKMVATLGNAIDRAKFLIPLNELLDKLIAVKNTSKRNNSEVCLAIERASQSVRQLTQNNNLNEDILKLAYLDLFAILESLKEDNIEKLFSYINSEGSRIRLSSEYFILWEDICEIRKCLAHGDNVIRKGKLNGNVMSATILLDWTLKLVKFILGFMTLYLKQ